MKQYVYCLTERMNDLPSWRGVAGSSVYALEVDKFSVFASDFFGEHVRIDRENVLAHAAVIQQVLNHTTPLPFKFGTLVTEQQLDNYVSATREALQSKLALVRGCVEMNVKIISSREPARATASGNEHETPGTAFLFEKRREIRGEEERAAEAIEIAAWLEAQLGDIVWETQINPNRLDTLLVAVAHLVRREAVEEYRARLKEARHERPELHFLISGPWAPYSFANIDLEFKTHFGVS